MTEDEEESIKRVLHGCGLIHYEYEKGEKMKNPLWTYIVLGIITLVVVYGIWWCFLTSLPPIRVHLI